MIAGQLVLLLFVVNCNTLSIGTVSDKQNVTKREAGGFYPDWVPFKNKNGEDLGEFTQVESKPKPKKRLALPVNFILKAVAEPEGDDYYDKGQGESDSEDDFEKKEWSDVNRPAQAVDVDSKKLNHTDISDIDGVVNIITNVRDDPITKALNSRRQKNTEQSTKELKAKEIKEEIKPKTENPPELKAEASKKEEKKRKYEDDVEYEENTSDNSKPEPTEEEKSESEAKKARILDSVDELKERHAEEQRAISEKLKEEEIYQEEHERDKITSASDERADKYDDSNRKKENEYDEYSEEASVEVTTTTTTTTARTPKRTKTTKRRKNKKVESGKLSVFKNPKLYELYDDDSETSTTSTTTTRKPNRGKTRKILPTVTENQRNAEESVRISLVPQDNEVKDGEPTLFFPKKRKNKRRRKSTTTPAPDSYVAETVEKSSDTTTNPSKTVAPVISTVTTVDTLPSAADITIAAKAVASNKRPVKDALPASSEHKKEKDHGNYHQEKGGAREYHSDHEEEHKEQGKKAYEGYHEDTKTAKGHHDKEDHHGQYDDHDGQHKEHHDEGEHYGAHHHEEHGKKQAKYEESGKHAKGHSTKGSHDIHKKEEYEKRVEFFEEDGDSGEEEKHGGFNHEHEHSTGGHFKKGNLEAAHSQHSKGDSGHHLKGGHAHGHKGHKQSGGYDSHGQHDAEHFAKEGKDSGKKWVYHHNHPGKTAHLVLVDRRPDQYQHGPTYYG